MIMRPTDHKRTRVYRWGMGVWSRYDLRVIGMPLPTNH